MISQFSLIWDGSIIDHFCAKSDKECAQMKQQWLRTDGKNYFAGWIVWTLDETKPVYLINDHFYSPGEIDPNETGFSTKWTFAGIQHNAIIIKKIIKGEEVWPSIPLWDEYISETKIKYTLKTCEVPLP